MANRKILSIEEIYELLQSGKLDSNNLTEERLKQIEIYKKPKPLGPRKLSQKEPIIDLNRPGRRIPASERNITRNCSYDWAACSASGCPNSSWPGDGYCDDGCNNEACCYDDGDCCPSTCVDATYDCDTFGGTVDDCIDPNASESSCQGDCDCPEGTYWDGFDCYNCEYCLTVNDDSECDYPCDCCEQCGGSVDGCGVCGAAGGSCGTNSCDYWSSFGYTCSQLETQYGCDCSGCECPNDSDVAGCTDDSACNYNADATSDDGSCDYASCCTAANACNYLVTEGDEYFDGACSWWDCNGDCTCSGGNQGLPYGNSLPGQTCVVPDNCNSYCASCNCDCAGTCNGSLVEDDCGVCGGNNSTCDPNCPDGVFDECDVCDGDNSSCADCEGIPNGIFQIDDCGVCSAPSYYNNLLDCNGECDEVTPVGCEGNNCGTAEVDECGECTGGTTGLGFNYLMDCAGECGGDLELDDCGVCGGDGADVVCGDGAIVCFEELCGADPDDYVILWGYTYYVDDTTEIILQNTTLAPNVIPSEIGQLTNLEILRLDHCELEGTLPSTIENLINLEELRLNNNQLTGSIPTQIEHLINLEKLYLHNNQLGGQIPSEIHNLTNLKQLYLYGNDLTGEIPSSIGLLTNLTTLYLNSNHLIGEIPHQIGELTNLHTLKLQDNKLRGYIPQEICNQGDSTPNVDNNFLCPLCTDPNDDATCLYPICDDNDGEITSTDEQNTFLCECPTQLGDMNGDGGWNVLDIVAVANCVLVGNCLDHEAEICTDPDDSETCQNINNGCAGDMNGDGGYNVLDIVALANCVLADTCGGG